MDALLEYYKEQLAHGRHIETQRSAIAAFVAAGSGALLGKLLEKSANLTRAELPYAVALLLLNAIAALTLAKLYERFRLHNETARLARNKIDPALAVFRKEAECTNQKKYPLLYKIRLHDLWNWTFGALGMVGLVVTIYILLR